MKVKGIKKAVGDYRRWIKRNPSYRANIMMDTATGEVWTDCFISSNEWKVYQSQDIISLSNCIGMHQELEVTMDGIKRLILSLANDGVIPHFEVNYGRK